MDEAIVFSFALDYAALYEISLGAYSGTQADPGSLDCATGASQTTVRGPVMALKAPRTMNPTPTRR